LFCRAKQGTEREGEGESEEDEVYRGRREERKEMRKETNRGSTKTEKLTHRQHPPVSIELPHPVTSASLHPFLRDRFIAGSTNDPWVRVYDLDSGKEKEVYKGHHGPVLCASYSPDGEVYASGSEDGESLVICVDRRKRDLDMSLE
jgi:WD40 repeat protein